MCGNRHYRPVAASVVVASATAASALASENSRAFHFAVPHLQTKQQKGVAHDQFPAMSTASLCLVRKSSEAMSSAMMNAAVKCPALTHNCCKARVVAPAAPREAPTCHLISSHRTVKLCCRHVFPESKVTSVCSERDQSSQVKDNGPE